MYGPIKVSVMTLAFLGVMLANAFAGNFDVNVTNTGLAMRGYDPVAYHTQGKAVAGSFARTVLHDGAVYRFSSDENRDAFKADPAKYLPAYGGFCAFGLAQGVKVDADPELWSIVDGKLYLNLAPPVQKRWEGDKAGFIKSADEKWAKLKDIDPLETVK